MLNIFSSETWGLLIYVSIIFGGPLLIFISLIRLLGNKADEENENQR
jgi:hypothetical protein